MEIADEKFWEDVREEFPVTQNLAYFQSAGISPIPNRVLKAITQAYEKLNKYGDLFFLEEIKRADTLREKLGEMINTKAGNICFAPNTSSAFGYIATTLKKSNPLEFNIVSLLDEFPATNIPFEMQGIRLKFVEPANSTYTVYRILDAIDENTMAVVCSHVQYSTGFRLNIEELGKRLVEKKVLFFVNATQSFPFFEIDVAKMHIDALSASLHKWGLSGINGSMFYTSETFRKTYPGALGGWLSVIPAPGDFIPTQKNKGYQQLDDAAQYVFGTSNFQALAGLD